MGVDYNVPEEDRFYAAQLRDMGHHVDDDVPDCAWIPRWAIKFGEPRVEAGDGQSLRVSVPVTFTEAFRWFELNLKVPP